MRGHRDRAAIEIGDLDAVSCRAGENVERMPRLRNSQPVTIGRLSHRRSVGRGLPRTRHPIDSVEQFVDLHSKVQGRTPREIEDRMGLKIANPFSVRLLFISRQGKLTTGLFGFCHHVMNVLQEVGR